MGKSFYHLIRKKYNFAIVVVVAVIQTPYEGCRVAKRNL